MVAEDVQADCSTVFGPAVAKQRSPNWLCDLLTTHVRLSADRKRRWPVAVTSIHLSARYTGDVLALPGFVMHPCDSVETFTFLSAFASVSSTFEAVVPKDFLSF